MNSRMKSIARIHRNVLGSESCFSSTGAGPLEKLPGACLASILSMLMMLQMHDIETAMCWAARVPSHKLWDILEKYRFEDPALKVHLYYQQKEIRSSNPEVRITWYETPDNHKILILGNKDVFAQETTVDLTSLTKENFTAREEYEGFDVPVQSGIFKISVPSRSMRIVAFPAKKFYPYKEDFFRSWSFWKGDGSDAEYRHERDFGRGDRFSMRLINGEKTGVLTKKVPAIPGKQYKASIWCMSTGDTKATIAFQAQKDGKFLGLTPQSTTSTIKAGSWQQIEHSFTIPETGKWADCNTILITIGSTTQSNVVFDDFLMQEIDPSK